jgi:hypothetical protein
MYLRFVKTVLGGILLMAGVQAKVEFEEIHVGQQAGGSYDLSRACTQGFKPLRDFFRENGVRFDPKIVHSHRGRYCHIYYAPTKADFEADHVGASWVAGSVNGGKMLLVPRQDAHLIVELDLPSGVPFMLSKLQWHISGFELVRAGPRKQSRVLVYGKAARELLGGAIRDQEYEYLLKVEFGVDAVKKRSRGR